MARSRKADCHRSSGWGTEALWGKPSQAVRRKAAPCAGYRNGSSVNNVGSNGNYWSATPNDTDNARNMNFNSTNANTNNWNNRNNGQSVRLVQELK